MNRDGKEIDVLSHDRKGGMGTHDLILYFNEASVPVIRVKNYTKTCILSNCRDYFNLFAII